MLLGHLLSEVYQSHPNGRKPSGRPRTRWRDYIFHLVWNCLRILRNSWEVWLGRGMSGILYLASYLHDPSTRKLAKSEIAIHQ